MISILSRGSVKNLLGPGRAFGQPALVFDYSDAFSVFDWGRMPDVLPKKGEALAILAADFFERLEKPETWREFSKSPEALALRKAHRFGVILNEIGEELQSQGLRTHFLGVLESAPTDLELNPKGISQVKGPFRRLVVKQVSVVKPILTTVLGRTLADYYLTRASPLPRLVPLEVVFRMGCPKGSSLLERVNQDPGYLATLGFANFKFETGAEWDFPILELFTQLETVDRALSLSEALAISGLSASQLQEVLFKTVWVAGVLRFWFAKRGLKLADGKLEWALSEDGRCFLVDAIGPDELSLLKNGIQVSKEFLRTYFRKTHWYASVEKAKAQARSQGAADWKRLVQEPAPALPPAYRELAIQVYLSLTNELTGKKWFPEAWPLEKVVRAIEALP